MPRASARKRVHKVREYPVISPSKGAERIKRYAVAIQPPCPKKAYRAPTHPPPDITQKHQQIPSDMTLDDWDTLHNKLGAPTIIPESPPAMNNPSCLRINTTAPRIKVSVAVFEGHVHDSEGESDHCVYCL